MVDQLAQARLWLNKLQQRRHVDDNDDSTTTKLLVATIAGALLIVVLSLLYKPRPKHPHGSKHRAITGRIDDDAAELSDSSLYTSDDSSSARSSHHSSSSFLITSTDTTSNLSVRPVHIEIRPPSPQQTSAPSSQRSPWRSPPLRSTSPSSHHQHVAGSKRRRRTATKTSQQQRLSVQGLGILGGGGDGSGSSNAGGDDEDENDDDADQIEAAEAVASIRDDDYVQPTDVKEEVPPPLPSKRASQQQQQQVLAQRRRRPRTKRKVGSLSSTAVNIGEVPAPIPQRNSSYHKMASVPEPDTVLLGRSAKDAPPSILRKEAQRFRHLWATRAHHASDFGVGSQRQQQQQRLIKLTEPDWDPYAETHERARQRIEMRQLASKGLARTKSESALSDKARLQADEPLGSWLAYAPLHSPSDDDDDAGMDEGAPTLPRYDWEAAGSMSGIDGLPAALEKDEALPAALGGGADSKREDFWFERYTSSTAAAGRDWDWRKRRARERAKEVAAAAAAIEHGGHTNGHANGQANGQSNGNGHAHLQPFDAAATPATLEAPTPSPLRRASSPALKIAAAFSKSPSGSSSPSSGSSPITAPFRRGSSSS